MTNARSEHVRVFGGDPPRRAFPRFPALTAIWEQEIFLLEGPPAWTAAEKSPVYVLPWPQWVRSDRTPKYIPSIDGHTLIWRGVRW